MEELFFAALLMCRLASAPRLSGHSHLSSKYYSGPKEYGKKVCICGDMTRLGAPRKLQGAFGKLRDTMGSSRDLMEAFRPRGSLRVPTGRIGSPWDALGTRGALRNLNVRPVSPLYAL